MLQIAERFWGNKGDPSLECKSKSKSKSKSKYVPRELGGLGVTLRNSNRENGEGRMEKEEGRRGLLTLNSKL